MLFPLRHTRFDWHGNLEHNLSEREAEVKAYWRMRANFFTSRKKGHRTGTVCCDAT
jgi:hypothetical protein